MVFYTTKYADELLDFSDIDWPERVKLLQTNWIGRSEGASVLFPTEQGEPIEVFTTRPDTLWGATFMVLAPGASIGKMWSQLMSNRILLLFKEKSIKAI